MEGKVKKTVGIALLVCVTLSVTVLPASAKANPTPIKTTIYSHDGIPVKVCTKYSNGVTVCQTNTGKTTTTFPNSEGTVIRGSSK